MEKKSGLMAKAEAINEAMAEEKKDQQIMKNQAENQKFSENEAGERKARKPRKVRERKVRRRREREHSGINRILTKIIIILILLCSLVGGGLFAIRVLRNTIVESPIVPAVSEKKTIVIQDQLLYCQELVTMKYKYSDIVSIKKSTKIGFSKSYSIIKYTGIVRAGIADMTACTYEVSADEKSIVITLPPVEILGNDILSQEVFDEQQSVFVPITLEEVFNEIEKSREDALDEIKAEGLLDDAKEHARKVVKQIMLSAGFEDVIVL